MTEITKKIETMPQAIRRFVLHWGDMGGQWGVNRSVAQIHALLYISEAPMTAEDICDCLGIARSNVSNSLKELLGWKIIRREPVAGDRRDHFVAEVDVWEIAKHIAAVRKQRELEPALETLDACLAAADADKNISPVQRERLLAMQKFTQDVSGFHEQMMRVPAPTLLRLVKMGDKIVGLLNMGRKPKD